MQTEQTTVKLLPQFIEAIKTMPALQGKIAACTGKSNATIYRWAKENDSRLTMLTVLHTIRQYLELPADFVLTGHATQSPKTA
jgi:hypothetical protein